MDRRITVLQPGGASCGFEPVGRTCKTTKPMDALSEYEMEVGIAFVRHLSGTVAVKTARHPEIPPLAHLLYSSTAVHLYSSTGYDTYHGGVPGIDPVRHTCLQDGERMPRGMHPTAVSHSWTCVCTRLHPISLHNKQGSNLQRQTVPLYCCNVLRAYGVCTLPASSPPVLLYGLRCFELRTPAVSIFLRYSTETLSIVVMG